MLLKGPQTYLASQDSFASTGPITTIVSPASVENSSNNSGIFMNMMFFQYAEYSCPSSSIEEVKKVIEEK